MRADPCDGPSLHRTALQEKAARDRRPALHDLARQAREISSRTRHVPLSHFDLDTVTPIGPGMVSWGGPGRQPLSIGNVHPVAARVEPSDRSWLLEIGA